MKIINEMMISAYLKGMSKLNAFKDNVSCFHINISLKAIVYMETAHSFLLRADSR